MSCDQNAKPGRTQNPAAPIVISVCITCRAGAANEQAPLGAVLLDTLKPLMSTQAPDVVVRAVQCLGVCKRPGTVAISARDGFTFVFGDLQPDTAPAAIASFVDRYRTSDYGFVPWRERPLVLRRGLVARIPSANWSPEDGHPPA